MLLCEKEAFPSSGSAWPLRFVYTQLTHKLEAQKNHLQVRTGDSGSLHMHFLLLTMPVRFVENYKNGAHSPPGDLAQVQIPLRV